eukprot:jgi/Mesvir1/15640/Mv03245-RA.1
MLPGHITGAERKPDGTVIGGIPEASTLVGEALVCFDQLCQLVADILAWKDDVVTIAQVPSSLLTKLTIASSNLYRRKTQVRPLLQDARDILAALPTASGEAGDESGPQARWERFTHRLLAERRAQRSIQRHLAARFQGDVRALKDEVRHLRRAMGACGGSGAADSIWKATGSASSSGRTPSSDAGDAYYDVSGGRERDTLPALNVGARGPARRSSGSQLGTPVPPPNWGASPRSPADGRPSSSSRRQQQQLMAMMGVGSQAQLLRDLQVVSDRREGPPLRRPPSGEGADEGVRLPSINAATASQGFHGASWHKRFGVGEEDLLLDQLLHQMDGGGGVMGDQAPSELAGMWGDGAAGAEGDVASAGVDWGLGSGGMKGLSAITTGRNRGQGPASARSQHDYVDEGNDVTSPSSPPPVQFSLTYDPAAEARAHRGGGHEDDDSEEDEGSYSEQEGSDSSGREA